MDRSSIFQELNGQGLTVLLVTHEMNVAEHARRVVTFKDGLVLTDARPFRQRLACEQPQSAKEQSA